MSGPREQAFARLYRDVRERRGDRVLCERLLRAIAAHLEIVHYGQTMDEIRQTSPDDYVLYKAALS